LFVDNAKKKKNQNKKDSEGEDVTVDDHNRKSDPR